MEVIADILLVLGKVLIHLFEPLVWLGMGLWKWWTTELPEVLTYEEPTPQVEPEWDTTKTPAKTYYIICIAFVILLQILLSML